MKEIGKGGISLRQAGSFLIGRAIMMLGETFAVGADTKHTMYRHDAEEAGIAISGRIEMTCIKVTMGDQC